MLYLLSVVSLTLLLEREIADIRCYVGDKSTRDDWVDLGKSLFEQKLFDQSAAAFERAGETSQMLTALAYAKRKIARLQEQLVPVPSRVVLREAYVNAGTAFHKAASATHGGRQRVQLFELAGDSFSEGNSHDLAAETYESAAAYDQAALSYLTAKNWTDAVRIIKTQTVSEKTSSAVVKEARIEFCKTADIKAAREVFDSTEEQIECTYLVHFFDVASLIDCFQIWKSMDSTSDQRLFDCRLAITLE